MTDRTDSPTWEELDAICKGKSAMDLAEEIWWLRSETGEQTDEKGRPMTYWGGLEAQPNAAAQDNTVENDQGPQSGDVRPVSAASSGDKSETPRTDARQLVRKLRRFALPDPHDERDVWCAKELVEAADFIEQLERELNAARSATGTTTLSKKEREHIACFQERARVLKARTDDANPALVQEWRRELRAVEWILSKVATADRNGTKSESEKQ